jgi:hypothetical protein
MPFREALWVTLGTLAPVIALASIVALNDVIRAPYRINPSAHPPGSPTFWRLSRRHTRLFLASQYVAGGNMILQLLILIAAVQSLAKGHNFTPPELAAQVAPYGIFLLFISGALAYWMRQTRRHIDDEEEQAKQLEATAANEPPPPLSDTPSTDNPPGGPS